MRLSGWEVRLEALIEAARKWKFEWGKYDCFRFVCEAQNELTGVNRWPEFGGQYSTEAESLSVMFKHGRNMVEVGNWFFSKPSIGVKFARRGDAVLLEDEGRKPLGVCVGTHTAFLGHAGLVFLPTMMGTCAWRVG